MSIIASRSSRRFAVVLGVTLGLVGSSSGVLAWQTGTIPGAVTPPAADCIVEPRTPDSLIAIFADATPVADSAPETNATIPLGVTANEATSAEITATIHQAFACQNAGDFARFFALLTDHAILTIFPWIGPMLLDDESAAEMLAVVPPGDDFQQTILGIGAISDVGDGRFTAVVVFADPNASEPVSALHLTFFNIDGVWLIDGAIDFHTAE